VSLLESVLGLLERRSLDRRVMSHIGTCSHLQLPVVVGGHDICLGTYRTLASVLGRAWDRCRHYHPSRAPSLGVRSVSSFGED